MCGINGIYGIKDKEQAAVDVIAMNSALAHRGPDDEGTWQDNTVALGHKRLSIIDLSASGKQPIQSRNGRYVMVYNGELYNYQELKKELSGYEFQTQTDTEVALAAFEKWGVDCLSRLNGMFAFAVWDIKDKKLWLVRDRMGIKPLYYYRGQDTLLFSSELRALLIHKAVPRKLSAEGLADYLRYQTVHAPETIIQDVKMLLPGHYAKISEQGFETKQWWSLKGTVNFSSQNKPYEGVKEDVRTLLKASVKRRMVADVPFGAFLSGGIDSSIVVGLMSEVASQPVKTFNVSFDEKEFSESRYAKLIAKKFGTDHHEILLNPHDFLNELPNALGAMDHPGGDGPNTYIVSKVTKDAGITMALSGLGGDELFAGYDIFSRSVRLEKLRMFNKMPRFLMKAAGNVLNKMKPGIASQKIGEILKASSLHLAGAYPFSRQLFMDSEICNLLTGGKPADNKIFEFSQQEAGTLNGELPFLSKVSMLEISTYLQNVLLRDTDQMSMAHALEVRVPFLDHELVEYVMGIKDEYKYPVTPKKLLVDSVNGLLPYEVVNRPKMGFTFPWKSWIKNELHDFCRESIHNLAERKQFNSTGIKSLWQRFLKDDPYVNWSKIWILVVLQNWLKQHKIE